MNTIKAVDDIFIEVATVADFAAMRETWNALLEQSSSNEIFLSWEWMHTWWEVYQDIHIVPYILVGKDTTGTMIGIAPFYIEHAAKGVHSGNKTVRFCSSLDTYPDHLDLIVKQEHETRFTEKVFEFLKQHDGDWDEIKLDGIKEKAILQNYLISMHHKSGYIVDSMISSECPYLPLQKNSGSVFDSLGMKSRSTLARKRKNLLERSNCHYGIAGFEEEDSEKYFRTLFSLHATRAERKGIKTTFSGEKTYSFHKKFIASSSQDRKTVVAFIRDNDDFLVLHYCLRHNNKYYIYQTGISEEGERKSAGTILFSILIKNAYDEGSSEFDFSRGKHEYKLFWTDHVRRDYTLLIRKKNLFNWITFIYSHHLLRPGKKMAKPLVVSLEGLVTRWVISPINKIIKTLLKSRIAAAQLKQVQVSQTDKEANSSDIEITDNTTPHANSQGYTKDVVKQDVSIGAIVPAEVEKLIGERTHARQNREWQRADEIRNYLKQNGIEIQDTPKETTWKYLETHNVGVASEKCIAKLN